MTFCVNTKRKRSFLKLFSFGLFLAVCSGTLLAQKAPAAPASDSTLPRTEIFLGYNTLGVSTKLTTNLPNGSGALVPTTNTYSANLNGWGTSITGFFTDRIGVTAEFTAAYGDYNKKGTTLYTTLFGPTYRVPIKRVGTKNVTVFGRALVGGTVGSSGLSPGMFATSGSVKYFTMAYGGGLDINWKKHISLRPVQADWTFGREPVDNIVLHNVGWRYMPGVVFTF